jgi:hypothetical protein
MAIDETFQVWTHVICTSVSTDGWDVRPAQRKEKRDHTSDICHAPLLLNKFKYLPGCLFWYYFSTWRNNVLIKLNKKNITRAFLI